jgi:hypothetical protein
VNCDDAAIYLYVRDPRREGGLAFFCGPCGTRETPMLAAWGRWQARPRPLTERPGLWERWYRATCWPAGSEEITSMKRHSDFSD